MAGKLKFAQNLYLGEGIAPEKLDKLKKRLNKAASGQCISDHSGQKSRGSAGYF